MADIDILSRLRTPQKRIRASHHIVQSHIGAYVGYDERLSLVHESFPTNIAIFFLLNDYDFGFMVPTITASADQKDPTEFVFPFLVGEGFNGGIALRYPTNDRHLAAPPPAGQALVIEPPYVSVWETFKFKNLDAGVAERHPASAWIENHALAVLGPLVM